MNRLKRIDVNWEYIVSQINEKGFSFTELAEIIKISPSVFSSSKKDGKMNPLVLLKVREHTGLNIELATSDLHISRIRNGRSTSGRRGVDWLYLENLMKEKGITQSELSVLLGKSPSYYASCKREGGMSLDIIQEIAVLFEVDYHTLLKMESYDKWLLRNEIKDMVNGVDFTTDLRKNVEAIKKNQNKE